MKERKDERVINEAGRKRTGNDEGGKYGEGGSWRDKRGVTRNC